MNYISDELRHEASRIKSERLERERLIAEKAVADFCGEDNLSKLDSIIQAKVREQYLRHEGDEPIYKVVLPLGNDEYSEISESIDQCASALKSYLDRHNRSVGRVTIKHITGYGDPAVSEVEIIFHPPLR